MSKADKESPALSNLNWLFLWCFTWAHILLLCVPIWMSDIPETSWELRLGTITTAGVYHDNIDDFAER